MRERRLHLLVGDAHDRADPQLGAVVDVWFERARAACPEIDEERFAAHVAKCLPDGEPLIPALNALDGAELYLAFGCAEGAAGALARFEREYLQPTLQRLARTTNRPLDDLGQMLRERLFVGSTERPAAILAFTGRGRLARWLDVTATRIGINFATRGPRDTPVEDSFLIERLIQTTDPQLELLRTTYAAEMRDALVAAIRGLSSRDRNLLRYTVVESMSIDQLGAIYGVHRATAARWIQATREELGTQVRAHLQARLGVSGDDLASIIRLVRSQLDVSINRYLGDLEKSSPTESN